MLICTIFDPLLIKDNVYWSPQMQERETQGCTCSFPAAKRIEVILDLISPRLLKNPSASFKRWTGVTTCAFPSAKSVCKTRETVSCDSSREIDQKEAQRESRAKAQGGRIRFPGDPPHWETVGKVLTPPFPKGRRRGQRQLSHVPPRRSQCSPAS